MNKKIKINEMTVFKYFDKENNIMLILNKKYMQV